MNYKRFVIYACISILLSCVRIGPAQYMPTYRPYHYEETNVYSQGYYQSANFNDYSEDRASSVISSEVTVPETYHVGANHSPRRAKENDKNWVYSQNPQ